MKNTFSTINIKFVLKALKLSLLISCTLWHCPQPSSWSSALTTLTLLIIWMWKEVWSLFYSLVKGYFQLPISTKDPEILSFEYILRATILPLPTITALYDSCHLEIKAFIAMWFNFKAKQQNINKKHTHTQTPSGSISSKLATRN